MPKHRKTPGIITAAQAEHLNGKMDKEKVQKKANILYCTDYHSRWTTIHPDGIVRAGSDYVGWIRVDGETNTYVIVFDRNEDDPKQYNFKFFEED